MIYDVSLKILIVLTTILIIEVFIEIHLPLIEEIVKKFTKNEEDDDEN